MTPMLAELILDSPRLWPLVLLTALLVAVLVWRLYRGQVRSLPGPWRWLLPALRCTALLALVLSLLKPVVVHPAAGAEAGSIVLLVDNSASMSVRDLAYLARPAASASADLGISHLVALADGLGQLPAGRRDPALADYHNQLRHFQVLDQDWARARGELDFAGVSGQGVDAARARLAQADSRLRTAAADLVKGAGDFPQTTRAGEAVSVLRRFAQNSGRRAGQDPAGQIAALLRWADDAQVAADVSLYHADEGVCAVCDRLAGMSRFQRVEMALTAPGVGLLDKLSREVPLFGYALAQDLRPLPLRGEGGQNVRRLLAEPTGRESDLSGGVQAAIAKLTGQPLQAIILISDGRQVGGDPMAAPDLGATDVPLFAVYSAGPTDLPLRDVSVADLSLPATAFVGETLTARVQVRSSAMAGSSTTVSLAVDNGPPTTRPAELSNDAATIEFPLKFAAPGVHHIVASVPAPPDAPTDANKHMDRWVDVAADKLDVGLYGGNPGWDFQYLANALSRTGWIDLHKGILAGGAEKLDLTPRQILDLNLLVLFDVSYSALTPAQWDAVRQLVADQGGRVLLVAGDENIPRQYTDHPNAALLLPYSPRQTPVWRDWPGRDPGFHASPADSSANLDFLKLADDPASSQAAWTRLPPFFRYLLLPGLKPAAQPLLVERDSSAPLLVETRVGSGRAFFMAMNETWRWRLKVGERDQDRFWLQLIRYAARPPYAARAGNLWLDVDPVSARLSQPIHIRARALDSEQHPLAASTLTAQLDRKGVAIRQIILSRTSTNSAQYEGTLTHLPQGDYQLRVTSPADGAVATLPLHVAAGTEEEMANLTGDPQFLRRIAEASGGAFLTLDQIGALPDLIHRTQISQVRFVQRPLWDSYYLYALVVACLAAEWAIRKRVGMI